jgi:hypothetical protein
MLTYTFLFPGPNKINLQYTILIFFRNFRFPAPGPPNKGFSDIARNTEVTLQSGVRVGLRVAE